MSASQAETYALLAAKGKDDAEKIKNIALAIAELASAVKKIEDELRDIKNVVYSLHR